MKSAGKAAAWSALGSWLGLFGGLVSLVIIARLLDPTDFGLYGFVLVTLIIPETIACNSLGEALVQRPTINRGHSNSIFVISMVLAAIFFLVIILFAPLISQGYGHPELTPYLRVMAAGLFLGAATAVPSGHLLREMKFKEVALVDAAGTVVSAVVGITLAFLWRDAWALIGMELARRLVRMLAFSWFARWLPGIRMSLQEAKDLMRFNIALTGYRLAAVAEEAIPRLLVGMFLGPAALGMFNLALRVQEQASTALIAPFGSVSYAIASRIHKDKEALHRILNAGLRLAGLIAYPALIGAIAIAPFAVPFVFGEKWVPATLVIQISLINGLRRPSTAFNGGIIKGIGRPDLLLKTLLISLLTYVLMPFAAMHSLAAVMWVLTLNRTVVWLFTCWVVQRKTDFSIYKQLAAGSSAFFASIAMALIVWGTSLYLPANWDNVSRLMTLVVIGIVTYPACLFAIAPRMSGRYLNLLITHGWRQTFKRLDRRSKDIGTPPDDTPAASLLDVK